MASGKTDRRSGEFELIAELFAPLSKNAPGAFGLTDDAAVLAAPPGHELVLKTDAVVEGVHFFRTDPPGDVARKALRVNLSDLAAKGAAPVGYLMALLLPDWPDMAWLRAFADGLAADQATFGLSLLGGDTTATPGPLAVSISAFGHVPAGAMIRRAGAKPGELVVRYRVPEPRLTLGPALRGIASASLDVSDGLMADLGHIASVSKVRIEVDAARIPLSDALRGLWGAEAAARAAVAGDDYEIAFTAPASRRADVANAAARSGVAVAEIGRVVAGEGAVLLDASGRETVLTRSGYTHF
jgi:thiamine-monophosphate kinase